MEILANVFGVLIVNVPLYIAWLVGIVIAIVRWQRHPRVSLYITLGLVIMLLTSLTGTVVTVVVPRMLYDNMGASSIGLIFSVVGIITGLINTAAWVLILLAVFGQRSTPALQRSEP